MFTLITFLFFTLLVAGISFFITKKSSLHTQEGYFLAGRSLSFPFIAGSLLLTNLSTEQLVGLNGAAFQYGLSVMAWEVVATISLILMALFFLPRFLKSGIATVPQYFRIRFDFQTEMIANFIFLIAYAVILLPVILYTGATGLMSILDIKKLLGIESEIFTIWLIVWTVGIIGSVYALWGGLKIVAISDTINAIGLFIGGLLIPYLALNFISDGNGIVRGWEMLTQKIENLSPEKMISIGTKKSQVPFSTLFTGVLLLNLFYWCTNQQIIQRTFGSLSLKEGQKGILLTGALKLLGPVYLVIPGLIAFYIFAEQGIKSDQGYGVLVRQVLPNYLIGFFAAVMMGAILSSFNSALNSTCTIFSLGVYQFFKKEANEKQVIASGKIFGFLIALTSMFIAPFLYYSGGIFGYLQKMNGIYFIPIFSVVLMGMIYKKTSPRAAKVGLLLGLLLIVAAYFVYPLNIVMNVVHEFHFLGIAFTILLIIMFIISKIDNVEKYYQEDVKAVDMTPWRGRYITAVVLFVLVIGIYIGFM